MILLIFLSWICSQVRESSSSLLLEGNNNNRNLENVLTRLNTRLDTIVLRIDHLDSRLGRIQSSMTNRLDGIENSVTNVKLRMDMLSEEVNRVDENLNRKWKIFESKIEASVGTLDSKYESKLNLLLREGRRLGDSFHGLFIGVEKRVSILVTQVNTSLSHLTDFSISSLKAAAAAVATVNNSAGVLTTTTTTTTTPPTTTVSPNNLITNKVSNMFEDLTERSLKMETMMKDAISLTNTTRKEMQDSFRSLFAHSNGNGNGPSNHHGGGGSSGSRNSRTFTASSGGGRSTSGTSVSSSEATSMAILETLASTESMSTTISRRLTELTRSIEERFELVSMTLNGFLESCIRIQEGAPLIEEHIAELLEKILNSFENNTTSLEYRRVWDKLDAMESQLKCEGLTELDQDNSNRNGNGTLSSSSSSSSPTLSLLTTSLNMSGSGRNSSNASSSSSSSNNKTQNNYDDIVRNSEHLAEEDKKILWQSLFPLGHLNGSYVPE